MAKRKWTFSLLRWHTFSQFARSIESGRNLKVSCMLKFKFLCKVDRENWFRTRFRFHFSISCLVNISICKRLISLSAFSSSLLLIPRVILISACLFLFFSLLFSILRQVYCVSSCNLNKQLQGRKTISRKCWIRQGFSDNFLSHQLKVFQPQQTTTLSRIHKTSS